jgi:hypothetical protein
METSKYDSMIFVLVYKFFNKTLLKKSEI